MVSVTSPAAAAYTLNFSGSENPQASIVLISGLASGSLFPYGSTEVVHNLVDADGTILDTCSFTVTVNDFYCIPTLENTEAITLVNIAGINNVSAADSIQAYEDFTATSGTVTTGSSYIATFEGYTGGGYTDFFTVYADWNQNGSSSDDERTEIGSIINSTGSDGIQVSEELTVPAGALAGSTTLRVIKTFFAPSQSPCYPGSGFGRLKIIH